ncbi:MAG: ABC transporter permease subunit [Saprospiraceae bacterium]|nr:ABC transporter permease subunit [Saprospiraceae bacterium]
MLYLLKLEFLKINNYRPFIVMMILYLILLPVSLLVAKSLPEELAAIFSTKEFYTFPNVWRYLGYIGNWLGFFFLGFMGLLSVTMEFSNKTLRQNIITGLSRKEYFFAKLIFITAISLIGTFYYFLSGTLIGLFHANPYYMDIYTQGLMFYISSYFLMSFAYMSLGLFFGMLVRRTGFAVFTFLAYSVFLERVIRGIHMYYIESRTALFYPVNAMSDLTTIPFPNIANTVISEMDFNPFLTSGEAIITVTIYTLIFLFVVYRLMMKQDL